MDIYNILRCPKSLKHLIRFVCQLLKLQVVPMWKERNISGFLTHIWQRSSWWQMVIFLRCKFHVPYGAVVVRWICVVKDNAKKKRRLCHRGAEPALFFILQKHFHLFFVNRWSRSRYLRTRTVCGQLRTTCWDCRRSSRRGITRPSELIYYSEPYYWM